jgi:3-dehydroquinate synthase
VREVRVSLARSDDLSYSVLIGRGILGDVLADAQRLHPRRRVFLVTDANVRAAGHVAAVTGGRPVAQYVIDPPGEVSKQIGTVTDILDAMESQKFGRDSLLVALGGGTVGDIGGFAAAIFKRGVPYVQVPTTTVAQADSSVGGKVGVDSRLSKNAYGVFKQPAVVYADVATLATLDDRAYRAGLVESVKHAMIADAAYFECLETRLDALLARDPAALESLAERNVTIKARVVEQDVEEQGARRILNYGHTVGHAVESASGYRLLHGEAVALGILAAARIAEELGLADESIGRRSAALLGKLGMPAKLPPEINAGALQEIMSRDKKALEARPRFVLLDRLGHAREENGEYVRAVDPHVVAKALQEMMSDE